MTTTHTKLRTTLLYLFLLLAAPAMLIALAPSAQAQCGPIDVAFVVDDTGSMTAAMYSFRAELPGIMDTIEAASGGDYRAALVTFKNNVTVRTNFAAANRAAIIAQAQTLQATGGGDVPEASDEAINTVVNSLAAAGRSQTGDFTPAFRTAAYKIIIIITDAPPGGFADAAVTSAQAHQYAVQATYKGIKIVALYVPNSTENDATAKPVLQDYASTTGGQFKVTEANGTGMLVALQAQLAICSAPPTGGGGGGGGGTPLLATPNIPSDDKPGSVLFFNLYTSDAFNPNQENTLISVTNTDDTTPVTIRLFWIAGDTGSVSETFVCLLPTRHMNIMASDFDPGVKGYALAVAIDSEGKPINFNRLIGSEMVKLKSGHQATLNAVSFGAIDTTPAVIDQAAQTATLKFDGFKYDFSQKELVVGNFQSPLDGDQALVIINKFGGILGIPDYYGEIVSDIGTIGTLAATLYDQGDHSYAASISTSAPQHSGIIRDGFPRMIPNVTKVITSGKFGWFRFSSVGSNSIIGSMITYNSKSIRNSGHNLRSLILTNTATYTMALVPPPTACQ